MSTWFGGNGVSYTEREVFEELSSLNPSKVYVGCDSQPVKDHLVFALAVCILDSGARYWIRRTSVSPSLYPSLSLRLINEVVEACLCANKIRERLDVDVAVHADVNASSKYPSNRVEKQVINYIKGMGFEYAVKPDSWASCSVADRHSK